VIQELLEPLGIRPERIECLATRTKRAFDFAQAVAEDRQ